MQACSTSQQCLHLKGLSSLLDSMVNTELLIELC